MSEQQWDEVDNRPRLSPYLNYRYEFPDSPRNFIIHDNESPQEILRLRSATTSESPPYICAIHGEVPSMSITINDEPREDFCLRCLKDFLNRNIRRVWIDGTRESEEDLRVYREELAGRDNIMRILNSSAMLTPRNTTQ